MDPDETKKNGEERRTCKLCFGTKGLIQHPVCDCTGSVGNICLNCLRQSITQVSLPEKRYVDEESGDPLCPDCRAPYRNIQFDDVQDNESFLDYINRTHGWIGGSPLAMFITPALILIGILIGTGGYFGLLSEFNRPEDSFSRMLITIFYIIGVCLMGGFLFGSLTGFYDLFNSYRRRPPTQLQINPSRPSRQEPRRPRNQDVVIEMDVIPRIKTPESDDSEVIPPTTPPLPPRPPSPRIIQMPQPPIEPPIPQAIPPLIQPLKFRPNELSRRGRRWRSPQQQQPSHRPPSARQRQSHTSRRSLQQQPRSRNQGRRQ